jgi:hypothetical protein
MGQGISAFSGQPDRGAVSMPITVAVQCHWPSTALFREGQNARRPFVWAKVNRVVVEHPLQRLASVSHDGEVRG